MRYITTTKNLFDNIVPANNCRVLFSASRAIATQITADTGTSRVFKIVSYNGSSYEILSFITDAFTLGRVTHTFTTPEITGYKTIIFGLNGAKIDTTCQCEINLKPSTTYTFSCNFTNITQGSISWTDMQLEEGSIATPYVPYGYLPMYKGRYKVSNVCQLLDKSKYPATQTINGVTFTNNGDGTITVNGTANELINFYIVSGVAVSGHKYCVLGCPSGAGGNTYFSNTSWGNDYGSGGIYTYGGLTRDDANYYIFIQKDYTANNLVFKPQLFDLTEMYGAGNEPTSVAEFKEKFPDDLYPYSPYCWAKIRSLIYKDNIDYIKMK